MIKITSLTQLKALLRNDRVIIRVLPFNGERIIKKYCNDCIEIPKEFNSLEELQNWKDFLKSKSKYKIIGRSYVIDLLLGKAKVGEGNLNVRGKIFTITPYRAIGFLSKRVNRKEEISKILDYSILTLKGYSTYILDLLIEGIKLSKSNKLDEGLKTFNRFRRILYVNENQYRSPEELLKNVYKGHNLKEDWERLSPLWREIIYYLIDSSLGLLPGESKRLLKDFDYSSDDTENISTIPYPEYVDIVNLALAELNRNRNVAIVGNLRTGKSTISELVKRRASELKIDLKVIDYHDLNGNFTSIEKLSFKGNKVLYVLTEDLFKTLEVTAFRISTDSRFVYSISRNKGLTLRLDDKITSIPMHYIVLYQTDNIESTISNALENFYADYWEYIYSVIFDSDPNKILWYTPVLAVYDKFNIPLPVKISSIILQKFGRKNVSEDDIILKWFSNCKIPFKVPRSELFFTDSLNNVDVDKLLEEVSRDIVKNIKSEKFMENLLDVYSYIKIKEGKKPSLEKELEEYFDSNFSFMNVIFPYMIREIQGDVNSTRYCEELKNSYLQPYEILSRVKLILMKPDDCVSSALDILLSASKSGKVDWILFVIDDLLKNAKLLKKYSSKISAILFNYLKYSTEELDKIKQVLHEIESEDEYAIFPKSIVSFIEGSLDNIQFTNPLWSVLTYGFLGIYALSTHDLLKLALIYDKFRKNYSTFKNTKSLEVDDIRLRDFFPISNGINDYIDELKDRLDAGIGYTLLLTHPREESVRATIELTEKLIMNWYNRIRTKLKEGKIKDNEAIDLLKIYQVKLMKSLISGGKYEYKTVLQDIVELENLSNYVKEQDVKGSLIIASSMSKRVLGIDEKPRVFSGTTLDLLLYISSEILLGSEDKSKFFDFISTQIKNKDEGIDKALVGIIISVIRNDKKELEIALEYAKENYYSAMLEILSKYINDRKMFTVALIPYVGIWHFLGG